MLKYLRIAVTCVGVLACVLLIALWVRSAYKLDHYYYISDTKKIEVWSCQSRFFINADARNVLAPTGNRAIRERFRKAYIAILESEVSAIRENGLCPIPKTNSLGFRWFDWGAFVMPYWFPVLLSASMAATPWIRWSRRFSMRTLLVVTTLIAMLMGLLAISR